MTPDLKASTHLAYVDCIRGYAIALVITCHSVYLFPSMPYPIHRILVIGWFGVQLFFLASCVTLLRSWNAEMARRGTVSVPAFFLRRLFRIAPAYYLAAFGYAVFDSQSASYTTGDIIATLTFTNSLHPAWAITTRTIVPGGWSVGAEFAFYAVFPLFAAALTSMRRAVLVFVGSVLMGLVANALALRYLVGSMPANQIDNGLFFWFPNEASVFALGGIVYFLAQRPPVALRRHATAGAICAVLAFWLIAYLPTSHYLGETIFLPTTLAVSVAFALGIVALSAGPSLFVNRSIAALGRVSFSAYLIHFAVIDMIRAFPAVAHTAATGYASVGAFAVVWSIIVLVTYGLSCVTYRWIELPMINLTGRLIRQWRRPQAKIFG